MQDQPTQPPDRPQSQYIRSQSRPDTCKRVTFALGGAAQDQNERLVKILSCQELVSKSSVVRGLLRFAEEMAIASGDPAVASVINLERDRPPKCDYDSKTGYSVPRHLPSIREPNPEALKIWNLIVDEILREYGS